MEQQLLAASLRSRADYELVKNYIDIRTSTYSKLFQIVMVKVGDYYTRDSDAQAVAPSVLLAQMEETIRNAKHIETIKEMLADAAGSATSESNVRAVVLLAKQQEAQDKLAQALASGITDKGVTIDEMIADVQRLRGLTTLEEVDKEEIEVFHNINLEDLLQREFDPDSLIKVYPSSLNDRLDGGAKRGHHFTLFGRPESMKSGTAINMSCGFLRQNLKGLYLINEDRPEDIIVRHVSNLSGMTKRQIDAERTKAQQLAESCGFENLMVANASPGTPGQIEDLIERWNPDFIVVDQLRNLKVKADNRVNQLEQAATAIRTIAKKGNVLAISVTQAGDSGSNKAVLEMGDIDSSNTGIPAQADVLIGVGVDATLEAENRRVFSLPKNKISGTHDHFPVNVVPWLSRVTSL